MKYIIISIIVDIFLTFIYFLFCFLRIRVEVKIAIFGILLLGIVLNSFFVLKGIKNKMENNIYHKIEIWRKVGTCILIVSLIVSAFFTIKQNQLDSEISLEYSEGQALEDARLLSVLLSIRSVNQGTCQELPYTIIDARENQEKKYINEDVFKTVYKEVGYRTVCTKESSIPLIYITLKGNKKYSHIDIHDYLLESNK